VRRIVEKYGVDEKKFHVVEVGVDSVEPLDIHENMKDRFVVMYCGLLGLGYDFDTVFDAASLLADYEDIVFVIKGVGELTTKLWKRIKALDLRNMVLDTGFSPREKLSALLRTADVFVLPMASGGFIDDGLPTKVFEYQAYGKPVICCSDSEPAKYVEATRSGLVIRPGEISCDFVYLDLK
jgi:glycosyltransferase involved in cell wall biosynthesis